MNFFDDQSGVIRIPRACVNGCRDQVMLFNKPAVRTPMMSVIEHDILMVRFVTLLILVRVKSGRSFHSTDFAVCTGELMPGRADFSTNGALAAIKCMFRVSGFAANRAFASAPSVIKQLAEYS
ncbi:MAG: hypothetical protein JW750_10140 [Anaerolineaceae bacterium]|nr:hypothetical protein [Anaerolineaceae bacterium]